MGMDRMTTPQINRLIEALHDAIYKVAAERLEPLNRLLRGPIDFKIDIPKEAIDGILRLREATRAHISDSRSSH